MGPRPVATNTGRGLMLLLVAAEGRAKLFPPRGEIATTLTLQVHYGHRGRIRLLKTGLLAAFCRGAKIIRAWDYSLIAN